MTKIEWTHPPGFRGESWNPTVGCSKVHAGCSGCYAIRTAHRLAENPKLGGTYAGLTRRDGAGRLQWTGVVKELPERLSEPERRRAPTCWFVDSMSDLFHERVSEEFLVEVFGVMGRCPRHRFIVLSKRIGAAWRFMDEFRWAPPLPNVIIGSSPCDQETYGADAQYLAALAELGWATCVSLEPLLGPVDLRLGRGGPSLSWVITGGESGPDARPSNPDWFRSLRDQCADAYVPFFFKQWGEWAPESAKNADGDYAYCEFHDDGDLIMSCRCEEGTAAMVRVGKARAGAALDGREHREFPEMMREGGR